MTPARERTRRAMGWLPRSPWRDPGHNHPARELLRRLDDRTINLAHSAFVASARLDALADKVARLEILLVGIDQRGSRLPAMVRELRRTRHDLRIALGTLAPEPNPGLEDVTALTEMRGGKLFNVNRLLETDRAKEADPRWLVIVDNDVILPDRFLDHFLAVCEHYEFSIAQPAQSRRSYANWGITRRRRTTIARETGFVEVGPVTAFRDDAARRWTPFIEAGMGWGVDQLWSVQARELGYRLGVVDATPVRHEDRPPAVGYSLQDAWESEKALLGGTDIDRSALETTLRAHYLWSVSPRRSMRSS